MPIDVYNFKESECAILDLIERKIKETTENKLVILSKLEVDDIRGGEEALYEFQKRMLIGRLTVFKNKDGLSKWHVDDIDGWMGSKFLNKIIANGGGYIFIITETFLEDWDYIAEAKKRKERLKINNNVMYELVLEGRSLILMDHLNALAGEINKFNYDSQPYKILRLIAKYPDREITMDIIKKALKMDVKKSFIQIFSRIDCFQKYRGLQNIFFPVLSNQTIRFHPKIKINEDIFMGVEVYSFLQNAHDPNKYRNAREYYDQLYDELYLQKIKAS